jgi:hypothetical protein
MPVTSYKLQVTNPVILGHTTGLLLPTEGRWVWNL